MAAPDDFARNPQNTLRPIRRVGPLVALAASAGGAPSNSCLLDRDSMGYGIDYGFSHHVIQCTCDGGTWTVQGRGPAGTFEILPNRAAIGVKTAVSTGDIWIVDSRGFSALAVVFGAIAGSQVFIASTESDVLS